MAPPLSDAFAGVNWTMPATSRKERPAPFDVPAVATGTLSVTSTTALPCAGTVTDDWPRLTACGAPAGLACETLNVAATGPWFFSVIDLVRWKSARISSSPKLSAVENLWSFPCATTCATLDLPG